MTRRASIRVQAAVVLLFGILLLAPSPSSAQTERILDFHSDITLGDDSSLRVTETITVVSLGNQIQHGIYREFPTRYKDAFNTHTVVGFEMLSATRDSAPEQFRVQDQFNGKRVYLGDPNVMVPLGRHVYTITYTTNRQIGFDKDHDELLRATAGIST